MRMTTVTIHRALTYTMTTALAAMKAGRVVDNIPRTCRNATNTDGLPGVAADDLAMSTTTIAADDRLIPVAGVRDITMTAVMTAGPMRVAAALEEETSTRIPREDAIHANRGSEPRKGVQSADNIRMAAADRVMMTMTTDADIINIHLARAKPAF